MNILWGSLLLLIGVLMIIGSLLKTDFILYKLLYLRAKPLWGEKAHAFLLVDGVIIALLSSLFFLGIWG